MMNKSQVISKHEFWNLYKSPEVKKQKPAKHYVDLSQNSSWVLKSWDRENSTFKNLFKIDNSRIKGLWYDLGNQEDNITVRSSDIDEFGD